MRSLGRLLILVAVALSVVATPAIVSADIQVSTEGQDLVLTCPGVFALRFDQSYGGGITEYYDLGKDPGRAVNIAAHSGSIYHGLFFILFKQEEPELWTASFRGGASVLEVLDARPNKVKVHVAGNFIDPGFGLPASYDFVYIVTSAAEIFIRARVIFNQAFSNEMQFRMALGLSTAYATLDGWVEFSQDQDLVPWYYYGGCDDHYLGARIEKPEISVDPVLIAYRAWDICDYILLIAPPKPDVHECLIAWVSTRHHSFTAGQVIENKYLLLMNQFGVNSPADPAGLASAYRAGNGGDFDADPGDPRAEISAVPQTGAAPLTVDFDGSGSSDSDGTIDSYEWDFGDGHTASGVTAAHEYLFPGSFNATLTVTDNDLNVNSAAVNISVIDSRLVIIDNTDPAPLFTTQGSWLTFDSRPGFYGANYAINEVGSGADWARWRPDLVHAGTYRVYASWSTDADRPTDAPFTVFHADGADTITVDMHSTDASGWNLLGEFDFSPGTSGYVELTDAASNGSEVIADAVKFEYVYGLEEEEPPAGDGDAQTDDGGSPVDEDASSGDDGGSTGEEGADQAQPPDEPGCGCSSSGGSDPWLLFLTGVILWLSFRRRRASTIFQG